MTRDNYGCTRQDCTETFPSTLKRELHIAEDHELPWEEIDNWPRGESAQ